MSEQDLELLEGTVSAVIFQNEENGYTILRLDICPSGAAGPGTPPTVLSSRPRLWSAACPRD